jgi:site-specific DNA recombinase
VRVAFVYVRQSRTDERSVSLDVQEAACRRLPDVAGCDKVELFRDEDISGATEKRPQYQGMLRRIRAAKPTDEVAVVSAYDLSRLGRDAEVLLAFHRLMATKPWIAVRFADGMPFGLSAMERAIFGTSSVFAEWHRNVTSEKIRQAYAHLNARGLPTGMPPYGYRRSPTGELVPDQQESLVVQRIFGDYANRHLSARSIADRLNIDGVRKPGSRSHGLGWVPDTVIDVVQNVAYTGRTYSISRARREGDVIEASWPAIIDPSLFEAAQRQIGRNRRGGGWTAARARHYAFQGLLQCAHCGRPMRAKTNYSAFYYYCRNDVALDQQCPGARSGVREERLLPWAHHLIERIDRLTPAGFTEAVRRSERAPKSAKSLESVDRALQHLKDLYTWGDISASEYQRKRDVLAATRLELSSATESKPTMNINGLLDAWVTGDPVTRRQLLVTLFEKLIVRDGEIVEYVPRKDRAKEVYALISAALGGSDVITLPKLSVINGRGTRRASGRSRVSRSGKGGIATLDWQYRVRIA